jgi:hypothetical protein
VVDPVVAEGVRAAIAAYTQALDDGRTDDVVATFCTDGVCEMPGMGTHSGHEALRVAYDRWKPRQPQRHLILNTLIAPGDNGEVTAISDVVFLLGDEAGWGIKLVGRYQDILRLEDGVWKFRHRATTFVTTASTPAGDA